MLFDGWSLSDFSFQTESVAQVEVDESSLKQVYIQENRLLTAASVCVKEMWFGSSFAGPNCYSIHLSQLRDCVRSFCNLKTAESFVKEHIAAARKFYLCSVANF